MNDAKMMGIMKGAISLYESGEFEIEDILNSICSLYPKSSKDSIKFIARSGIEMYNSLILSIDVAGGCGYSINRISEMTVLELISNLATNNIRFCYKKQEVRYEKI